MGILQFFNASWPRRILGIVLAAAVCLGAFLLVTALTDPYDCRMAPGVSIGGLDVSGMTKAEARAALNTALEARLYSENLTIALPQETMLFTTEEVVQKVRVGAALRDAYRFGRKDAPGSGEIGILDYITFNEEALRGALTAYAQMHDTTFVETTFQMDGETPDLSTANCDPNAPTQTLTVTLGIPELHLDVDAVYSEVLSVYSTAVDPEESGPFVVKPEVIPEKVPVIPDAQMLFDEFCVEAVDDSLDMEAYTFVPGTYGYQFDFETCEALLKDASCRDIISLPMEIVAPEIIGDAVYFREVLGEYQTKHNENENRNTNLRLLCQALDGFILQPGEEFSFNGTVGERTPEKGYKPAPAYSGNRLVNDYGGGVCQGSTTLYNCVLLADLEVVFRACHGATVSYVPLGLDATVNFLTTDFKFRNNFHFPIRLQAEVSDGYVKMKILGTDEKDYYVKMETRSGDDEVAFYARSYKCKYDKATDELISREIEAFSTYYKELS